MKQNQVGWLLILMASAMFLDNMSDAVRDLQDWHGFTTTAFVAIVMKQGSTVVLSVLGGKMQRPFGEPVPVPVSTQPPAGV